MGRLQGFARRVRVALVLIAIGPASVGQDARREYDLCLQRSAAAMDAGRYEEVVDELVRCRDLAPQDPTSAYLLGAALAQLGEVEPALDWLDRYAALGGTDSDRVAADPLLDPLRAEPRFRSLADGLAASKLRASVGRVRARLDSIGRADSPLVWQEHHSAVAVYGLCFGPDGERLLTWCEDGTARLWDAYTGRHLAALGPFSGWDVRCTFGGDGDLILVLDREAARVSLWDGRSGDELASLEGDDELVDHAALSPDGRHLAVALDSGVVRVHDPWKGTVLSSWSASGSAATRVEFSRDGLRLLTSSRDGRARTWRVENGEPLATFGDSDRPVLEACFAPDGQRILTLGLDSSLALHSADAASVPLARGHFGALAADLLSPDGRRCLAVGWDGSLRLWKVEDRTSVELRPASPPSVLGDAPRSGAFSRDGTRVLAAGPNKAFRLWDAETGALVSDLEGTSLLAVARFSPDGKRIAVGERDFCPLLFDAADGAPAGVLRGSLARIRDLVFAPDGARLAASSYLGHAEVWDLADPDAPTFFQGHSRAQFAWSLDRALSGDRVVSSAYPTLPDDLASAVARIWDLDTAQEIRVLSTLPGAAIQWARFARGGKRIVAAGTTPSERSPVVHVWSDDGDAEPIALEWTSADRRDEIIGVELDASGDRCLTTTLGEGARLWDTRKRETIRAFPETSGTTQAALLGPDGSFVVARTAQPAELILWDERSGATIPLAGHVGWIACYRIDADGRRLVSAGADGVACIWEIPSGRLTHVLRGGMHAVCWADFSPDGARVATAEDDGAVRLWNARTGEQVGTVSTSPTAVRFCTFSPDGTRLLTLGDQAIARVWSVPDGELVATLVGHAGDVGSAAFGADGKRILTMGWDDSVRVWNAEDGALLLTRIDLEGGEWLAFDPRGYFVGTPRAADWTRIRVAGAYFPLSSYASVLADPAQVAASLRGEPGQPPRLFEPPRIQVLSPRGRVASERSFDLEVLVEDSYGIQSVSVVQDGAEIPADRIRSVQDPDDRRLLTIGCSVEILPQRADTVLQVRATNRRGVRSAEAQVYVRYEPPQRDLYLMAIGVADYDDDSLDLACSVKDVDDLIARFRKEEGRLYRAVHVERLVDAEVTRAAIVRARDKFLPSAKPEDTLVVFAAGHAVRTDPGEYFFLPKHATPRDPYDGIDRQTLESLVLSKSLYVERRVLLIDTCHSGEDFATRKRGEPVPAYRQDEVDERLGRGLYIFAASSEQGLARERDGNGLFTRALLDGLAGPADDRGNKNGLIEIDELKEYATEKVHEWSDGAQRPTTPRVEGGERFPLGTVPD